MVAADRRALTSTRGSSESSLRAILGRIGLIVLAAVCALSPPTVRAQQETAAFVPAPLAPTMGYANASIGGLIASAPELVVAGERVKVGLLRRFYAQFGYEPVWATRQLQVNALMNVMLRAADHGLAPELFHVNLLRSPGTLPPLDRELLLSDAFLSYADALAHGVISTEHRRNDEVLAPEPTDVAAVLYAAIGSPDPGAMIEGLAPTTLTYRLLRLALQESRSNIPVGGKIATPYWRNIAVNLERERWLPRRLPPNRVWVNAADQRLVLYLNDRPVFSTRVIVGQADRRNQTPEFQATISAILYNPPWNIPQDIAIYEIWPKASQDANYLTRHNLVMLPDGGLQQPAGPNSALGRLMLEMTNRFDVYLHDTPSKNLFSREDRRISHGCIRVENPLELATLLMQKPIDAINQAIAPGSTARSELPEPVPIFIVYQTGFADPHGQLQFRTDEYGRDAEIWQNLDPTWRAAAKR